MGHSYFENRVAAIATMHQKERAIAPIVEPALGIKTMVPPQFDTDAFGTFTRDVDRAGSQVDAARRKAQKALEATGHTLAIASEGTFAPHPAFPLVAVNREIVLLLDLENDLELVGEVLSTNTNYNGTEIQSLAEAREFARSAGFPEHGLVVMATATPQVGDRIVKGIVTDAQLTEAVTELLALAEGKAIRIETDMRAMHNPTRMDAIAQATCDLVRKACQQCPQCQRPGFDYSDRRGGLPCALCQLPTALTLVAIARCQGCGFSQETHFPDGRETADPAQCQYCNP